METRDLRYFLEIAELGSVNAAAERVGRTQPALTKCIKRLEAELSGKLFLRGGRNIELTPLGRDLITHARLICRTVDSTIEELRSFAMGDRGRVKLGISPTCADSLLPDVVEILAGVAPGLRYHVLTGTPNVLRNALRTHEVDVIVGPMMEADLAEFENFIIQDDDVIVAAGPTHPLAGKTATPEQLRHYDWLLPTIDVHTRAWLDEQLRNRNIALSVRLEATSMINMRLTVRRGGFLTFIARNDMYLDDTEILKEVRCSELVLCRKIGVLYSKDKHLPPAATRFVDVLASIHPKT